MVTNCFLYTLINTSRRVSRDNAMNIMVMLHAKSLHKGKVYTGPKNSGFKIPVVPCRTSASFLLGSESFERRIRWLSVKKRNRGREGSPHATIQLVGFQNNLQ